MNFRHRYRDVPTPHVAEWTSVSRLAERIDAWRDLARRAAEPNPFYEPEYLMAGAELRGRDIRCVAVYRDGSRDSDLIGLFPVQRGRVWDGAILPALELFRNDYTCLTTPLIDAASPQAVWASFLDCVAHAPSRPHTVIGRLMPAGRPVFAALVEVLAERRLASIELERFDRAACLRPDRFETAFRRIRSHRRSDLGRRRRKMRGDGVAETGFCRGTDPQARALVQEFLRIEQAGWKGRSGTAMACRADTRAFAERVFTAPNAELDFLRFDGKVVAVDASIVAQGALFNVKTAYDEACAAYAPGLLMGLNMIRRLSESPGYERADSCAVETHVFNDLWLDRERMVAVAFGASPDVSSLRLDQTARLIASARKLKAWLRQRLSRG